MGSALLVSLAFHGHGGHVPPLRRGFRKNARGAGERPGRFEKCVGCGLGGGCGGFEISTGTGTTDVDDDDVGGMSRAHALRVFDFAEVE